LKTYEEIMRIRIWWAFFIAGGLVLSACTREKTGLETVKEQASYAIGQQMANNIARVAPEIDEASLVQGIKDALQQKAPLIDEQTQAEAFKEYNEVLQQAMLERLNEEAENNLQAANDFLEKNKLRNEVIVTESGLQYEMIQEGAGASPESTDNVTVHYRGTHLDGTEFDSSYSRNEPAAFRLNQVIPGWTEGLQLMKPGAKYILYVPPDLAYGAGGSGNTIGSNEALIFEVELLSVEEE